MITNPYFSGPARGVYSLGSPAPFNPYPARLIAEVGPAREKGKGEKGR